MSFDLGHSKVENFKTREKINAIKKEKGIIPLRNEVGPLLWDGG